VICCLYFSICTTVFVYFVIISFRLFSSVVNIKLEEVAVEMHCNLRPPDVMQVILGSDSFMILKKILMTHPGKT